MHAAISLDSKATVVIPVTTTEYMKSKLREAGASEIVQHGKSWVEADSHLKTILLHEARARGEYAVYVPPFDAPEIWDGNATMVHEIAEQLADAQSQGSQANGFHAGNIDAIVCSVGGGGLFSGVMQGLEDLDMKRTLVLAMETEGADSLSQALKAGHLITLPAITSVATSLGCRTVCQEAFECGQKDVVKSVVLTDEEAINGCRQFANDERIMVEVACGIAIAACYNGRLKQLLPDLRKDSKVVIVVCGGSNVSLEIFEEWSRKYK